MDNMICLVNELGKENVEYRRLENCCNILDSKRKPVTKASRQAGDIPYYGANGIQDYVANYIFDGTFVLVGEDGSVITEDGTPVVNWAEGKIWVNNHAHIIEEIPGVKLRYLYYYLQTVDVTKYIHGNIPKLNQGDFRSLMIAVPSEEAQEKIISFMDEYTRLNNELIEELQKEINERKKQYTFYRKDILSFGKED